MVNIFCLSLWFKCSIQSNSCNLLYRVIQSSIILQCLFYLFVNCKRSLVKSHVIYKLTCPGYNAAYIGKTDRCLSVRLDDHSSDHNSAMFQHLHSCEAFVFLFSLNNLPGCFNNKADVANFTSHVHQTILNNATITITNYVLWNLY